MTNVKQTKQEQETFYDRVNEYDKKMRKLIWGEDEQA